MKLTVRCDIHLMPLITHSVATADAPSLFQLLDERPAEALQAVLDFREELPATLALDQEETNA